MDSVVPENSWKTCNQLFQLSIATIFSNYKFGWNDWLSDSYNHCMLTDWRKDNILVVKLMNSVKTVDNIEQICTLSVTLYNQLFSIKITKIFLTNSNLSIILIWSTVTILQIFVKFKSRVIGRLLFLPIITFKFA